MGHPGPVRRLLRRLEQGYYKAENLDVEIKAGGPDIAPEQVVASAGRPSSGSTGCRSLLAAREQGGDLVNIAQVFAHSGMTELTWKDSNIKTPPR